MPSLLQDTRHGPATSTAPTPQVRAGFLVLSRQLPGTVFGAAGAGIQIRGFAQGNSVLNNRIRGHARAAFAVIGQNGGMPESNSFVANDLDGFQSSVADVFVATGVTNTIVIEGRANVEDHGAGTVIVPTGN